MPTSTIKESESLKEVITCPDIKVSNDPIIEQMILSSSFTNNFSSDTLDNKDKEISKEIIEDEKKSDVVVDNVIEIKTPQSNKKKKSKNGPSYIKYIGEDILEAFGSRFIIKKINKSKDENSVVRCELCEREFKKKSIRSHVLSLIHKSKIS